MTSQQLDVRALPKPQKHPAIFAAFTALPLGGSFILVNNHDPVHLHEEFETDLAGGYDWTYVERGPEVWRIRIGKRTSTALPHLLTNTVDESAAHAPDAAGAVWKLQVSNRDLDANIIALPPGGVIEKHTGLDVDVVIHVLAGSGNLITEFELPCLLKPGDLMWLPRRSERKFVAGEHGLRYLTVHQRRKALVLEPPERRRTS
ncbi:uncharacterized protein (DUF2249 family) [Mycobacterium frederiksbergense]|uniref:Uncharacterized protein (DUF2249 family) n=1 Tax=Mycolicibacterium frederiksbergense TaxID=117567 RepID=A0ABT6L3V2_9MYCO|nr:DUF2249 domain-containing protein [Mycolicibacterium frederiksbergense]MDH6197604.1 uncharacterized protein (DUF2249 family) [Mycolicibacterium frederiksbergense]